MNEDAILSVFKIAICTVLVLYVLQFSLYAIGIAALRDIQMQNTAPIEKINGQCVRVVADKK